MAREPGDPDQDWECEVCGATHPGSLVAGLRREVEDMLEMTGQADHGGLEWLVTMYQGCPPPRHALMLTIKRYLIYIYGRSRHASQPEHLERKIEYCGQILEACDMVMPGMTRERGLTLYELVIASIASGGKQPEELGDKLRDAAACLQWVQCGTFEYRVRSRIQELLQYLDMSLDNVK